MAEEKKLTTKEQRFVEEYCRDCNATQAAIRAGYSEKTAANIGYQNVRKLHISDAIKSRLKDISLPAEETTKLISDIAKGDIKEYYTVREVEEPTMVNKHLSVLIREHQEQLEFEEEYADRADLDEKEMSAHQAGQRRRRREILRMQMELERNPHATRAVEGPTVKVKRTELDMVKLVEDKERGRIKSVKPGEFGLTVELYPADGALDKLARMHGLYEKDNEQSKGVAIMQVQTTILPSDAKIASSEKDVEL